MASSTPKKRLGVAIFGFGRAGQIHFKNVIVDHSLQVLYVVDLRVEMAQELITLHNQDQCKVLHPDNQQEAFSDSRVDFVMICTPTFQHEPLVMASINSGKAVFCEKPVAYTEDAVARCYDAAESKNIPLFCSFNRRFDPSLRKIYDTCSKIGQIQVVKTCSRDYPFPPVEYLRISGGVYHDCLVHDIDIICWIIGEYPKQVYANSHSFNPQMEGIDDVDTVAAVMKFPSGTLALIDSSRDSRYGYDQRIEVFGKEGMLVNNNQRSNNLVFEGQDGASTGRIYDSFNERYAQSYVGALNHFKLLVRGEATMEVTKENTLNVSKIASALEQSGKTGKQVNIVY